MLKRETQPLNPEAEELLLSLYENVAEKMFKEIHQLDNTAAGIPIKTAKKLANPQELLHIFHNEVLVAAKALPESEKDAAAIVIHALEKSGHLSFSGFLYRKRHINLAAAGSALGGLVDVALSFKHIDEAITAYQTHGMGWEAGTEIATALGFIGIILPKAIEAFRKEDLNKSYPRAYAGLLVPEGSLAISHIASGDYWAGAGRLLAYLTAGLMAGGYISSSAHEESSLSTEEKRSLLGDIAGGLSQATLIGLKSNTKLGKISYEELKHALEPLQRVSAKLETLFKERAGSRGNALFTTTLAAAVGSPSLGLVAQGVENQDPMLSLAGLLLAVSYTALGVPKVGSQLPLKTFEQNGQTMKRILEVFGDLDYVRKKCFYTQPHIAQQVAANRDALPNTIPQRVNVTAEIESGKRTLQRLFLNDPFLFDYQEKLASHFASFPTQQSQWIALLHAAQRTPGGQQIITP